MASLIGRVYCKFKLGAAELVISGSQVRALVRPPFQHKTQLLTMIGLGCHLEGRPSGHTGVTNRQETCTSAAKAEVVRNPLSDFSGRLMEFGRPHHILEVYGAPSI